MTPYIPATEGGRSFYFKFSLLEYDGIPIVFLSVDEEKRIYLCECTDTRFGEQNWTICRTDYDTVMRLIDRQISLYEAIQQNGSQIILAAYNYQTEKYTQTFTTFDRLNPEQLPEPGTMIWLTNKHASDCAVRLFMEHSSSTYVAPTGSAPFVTTKVLFEDCTLNNAPMLQIAEPSQLFFCDSQNKSGFTCSKNGADAA